MIITIIVLGIIEILLAIVAIKMRLHIKKVEHRIQLILNDYDMMQFYGK